MPCRRKIEKTAALWWKSDLNDTEWIMNQPVRHCSTMYPGLFQARITLVFLVFLPDILAPRVFSFLGFYHAIPGCGICFNRSVPKKSSPAASNLSMFLRA